MRRLLKLQKLAMPHLDLKDCEYRLYWANEREVEAQFLHARMQAEHLCVAWLILQGSVQIVDASGTTKVNAGEWIFIKKGTGWQHFSAHARILSLRFILRNRGGEEILEQDQHLVFRSTLMPSLEARARELVHVLSPWKSRGNLTTIRSEIPLHFNLEIEAAFCRWLSTYLETIVGLGGRMNVQTIGDARVRHALALMEQHPHSQRISIAAIAHACGLGLNRLGTLFKQATGKSPQAYFESKRLQRAQTLLTESAMTLKEISWSLGFGSPQHFSNWFKTRTGDSPKEYRLSTRISYL